MKSQDSDIRIVGVSGGRVKVYVGRQYRLELRIQPKEGDCPFDFDYDPSTGTISHGHVGHELYGLG